MNEPDLSKLTSEQRREVDRLLMQGWVVRGLQSFIVGLGAYLGYSEGRGWFAFGLGLALAAWLQTQLPAVPQWVESLRKRND